MYAEAENMFYHLSTVSVASMSGRGVEQTAVVDADLMGEFLLGVGAAFQKKFYQANCQRAHDVSSSLFILVEFRPSYSIFSAKQAIYWPPTVVWPRIVNGQSSK